MLQVCMALAEQAGRRAKRYVFGKVEVGVVMVTLQGRLLGLNETARAVGETYHWHLPEE